MRLFAGITPQTGDETLAEAATAVAAGLGRLPVPRSLCEMQPDGEDYEWLCEWAANLTPSWVRGWLDSVWSQRPIEDAAGLKLSYDEAAGCLLLLLASEAARREAQEGYVWPVVPGKFSGSACNLLFVQGQPTRIFKDAVEAAARRVGLRNVFGLAGTQNYYVSVYLQFGFTQKGMARLPHWLAGQGTSEAIQYLTGTETRSLESRSFTSLWDALRNYRKNNISESQARRIVEESPWVLAEWTDELLKRTRERLELGTAEPGRITSVEEGPLRFLEEPRLKWERPGEPVFVSTVINLASLELTEYRYYVRLGAEPLAVLIRRDDETFLSDPDEIRMPGHSPQFTVTLVDANGSVHASQNVALWDSMEDAALFDLQTGRSLDPWTAPLSAARDYGLLLSPDLEAEPPDMPYHVVGRGGRAKKLYLLASGQPREIRAMLGQEELWSASVTRPAPADRAEPSWTRAVNTRWLPSNQVTLNSNSTSCLSVEGISDDTSLTYVRLGAMPLEVEQQQDGIFFTSSFETAADMMPPEGSTTLDIPVRLGLRRGNEHVSILRTLTLRISGVTRLTEEGWDTVSSEDTLTVGEAQAHGYRLFVPPRPGISFADLALIEGSITVRPLWRQARPIGSLGGFGASLGIRKRWNWPYPADLLTISAKVTAPGIVSSIEARPDSAVMICLSQPLEPGPLHQAVCWQIGTPPQIIDGSGIRQVEPHIWEVAFVPQERRPLVLAVSYEGARLGAWWPEGVEGMFDWPAGMPGYSPATIAALIRWMHLPIVSADWLDGIREFAHRHPARTLAAWFRDEGLPKGLSHEPPDEHWIAAVREVFSDWPPAPAQAWDIIQALAADISDDPVPEAAQSLLRIAPLLMGRVLKVWLGARELPCPGAPSKRLQLQRIKGLVAKLPDGASSYEVERREGELLAEVSSLMGVDPNFLDRGIVRRAIGTLTNDSLQEVDRKNLAAALGVQPFREYLGLRILGILSA